MLQKGNASMNNHTTPATDLLQLQTFLITGDNENTYSSGAPCNHDILGVNILCCLSFLS